eukprot:6953-Heterococcus_DN1.PRE.1
MATHEASAEYLARVNFKPLMEWLTARCILHRPEDPMQYCMDLLDTKISARSVSTTYEPRVASHYLTEAYDEAMTHADEHGIIYSTADASKAARKPSAAEAARKPSAVDAQRAPELDKPKVTKAVQQRPAPVAAAPELEAPPRKSSEAASAAQPDGSSVSIEGFFLPLVTAFADGAEASSRELMAKSILACACKMCCAARICRIDCKREVNLSALPLLLLVLPVYQIFGADQAALYGVQGNSDLDESASSTRGSITRASITVKPLLQLGTDFGCERKTVPRGGSGSLLAAAAHPPHTARCIPDTAADSSYSAAVDALDSDAPTGSLLIGPLLLQGLGGLGGGLVGVLALGRKQGGVGAGYKSSDEAAFKAFCSMAAAMLRHAAHYEYRRAVPVKHAAEFVASLIDAVLTALLYASTAAANVTMTAADSTTVC